MGINRKLADLAQFIDSSSSGESITKAATGVGTKAVVSADVQGSAGTFTFSDSSYIANVISPSYITAKTGKATSLTGTKSMFQGAMPDLIPQTTATYDLGDSAKPIAELILNSGANLFLGTEAFTSILSSGTANNVGGGAGGSSGIAWGGDRAVVGAETNGYQYYTITTPSSATTFGSFNGHDHERGAACSSTTRGLFAGGATSATNAIEYITFATTGNGTDFGDLLSTFYYFDGASNGTRGLFGGGNSGSESNVIQYVTIANASNATDFGDLTDTVLGAGAASDITYALFFCGRNPIRNNIDYVTIATTANATDFGDATYSASEVAAVSDATRSIHLGGYTGSAVTNSMGYVTTATPSNATDFGDLTIARYQVGTASNSTVGVFFCGNNASYAANNTIDQCVIQTAANCTDFADMPANQEAATACSGNPS